MKTILIAAALAMVFTLLGTRLAIGILVKNGYGQFIREDGPTAHKTKRGTPTMGGLVIILATVAAYFMAHLINWRPPSVSGLLVLYLFVGCGLIGFLDDWTKISKQRSLGLDSKGKLIGQTLVAVSFGFMAFQFPDEDGRTPASMAISFLRDIPWLDFARFGVVIGTILALIWIVLLVTAASNAVNLTDGLDGLATGACTMVFAAYALVNLWQYNQTCGDLSTAGPRCYEVRDPHDLAVVSLALAGACFGFLWWNTKPAKIFMGDSGSLSLGGALAGLAITTRTELLLVILAGLMVIITLSVILQVTYFKTTKRLAVRRGDPDPKGKRLFKMAPLQHHFEMIGWGESTIVVRFWIISGIFVALGLGIFYGEWVSGL
ncbi:phospho-N-acetylmuramoyl-pentapeptide-transferase [Granulicoccus phenolivorans]|uniref:phospho-N-acetylmuramoyl-pentapeptide- transferase n=1 Tax=Granulicoccus phenolivorans TaxID=266854 RepID=UPI0003F6051C|nr:phospho-N-acetylmuramoyl-pentapeptide-transferase [Granulicoccus phenolivorans]